MSKDIFFGLGRQYDNGIETSVAVNRGRNIVEVHKSQAYGTLWYRTGKTNQMDVSWGCSHKYDNGQAPSVALNDNGVVVEVHQSQTWSTLWYHVGRLGGGSISFGESSKYDKGLTPSIALDNSNWCVEVHKSGSDSGLWYHAGPVNSNKKTISWGSSHKYDSGKDPQVCMNNKGVVIEVHKSQSYDTLWYHVGLIDKKNKTVDWGDSHKYDDGVQPAIAVTDDGFVIELHKSQGYTTLWRRIGTVNTKNKTIVFSDSSQFDNGSDPSVACAFNGSIAIETHSSGNAADLCLSTSLIIDRSGWMQDRLSALKDKNLKQIALPASHDSCMYLSGLALLGKTQTLDIYGQLSYGIRYFDMRPGWDGNDLHLYHNFIKGPKLSDVLKDIERFMKEGRRELVILKFSHYRSFNDSVYSDMVKLIKSYINTWLFKMLPEDKRLADIPLGDYVENSGKILVVCDEDYPVNQKTAGFWVYRDCESDTADQGDLRVFDQYSNTTSYDTMQKDQIDKFERYNGQCENEADLPCDLFLLSWTLTPVTDVWDVAKSANRNIGSAIPEIDNPNSSGCFLNLLYVDYVEYSRVTDVAITLNGL